MLPPPRELRPALFKFNERRVYEQSNDPRKNFIEGHKKHRRLLLAPRRSLEGAPLFFPFRLLEIPFLFFFFSRGRKRFIIISIIIIVIIASRLLVLFFFFFVKKAARIDP